MPRDRVRRARRARHRAVLHVLGVEAPAVHSPGDGAALVARGGRDRSRREPGRGRGARERTVGARPVRRDRPDRGVDGVSSDARRVSRDHAVDAHRGGGLFARVGNGRPRVARDRRHRGLLCALCTPSQRRASRPAPSYAEDRSSRALAARIGASDRVVCFESFRPRPLLPAALDLARERHGPRAHQQLRDRATRRLLGREPLLPVTQLADVLGTRPAYLLTSTWRVQRLRRLSPSPLESVYTGRREVLLRPLG